MNFCPYCGCKRIESALFCHSCGTEYPVTLGTKKGRKIPNNKIPTVASEIVNIKDINGYNELLDKCTNLQRIDFLSLEVLFEGQIKRNSPLAYVATSIKNQYNDNYVEISKFILTEMKKMGRYYDTSGYYQGNKYSQAKLNQNQSNKSNVLDVIEMAIDYSSPRSAAKRIIKGIRDSR